MTISGVYRGPLKPVRTLACSFFVLLAIHNAGSSALSTVSSSPPVVQQWQFRKPCQALARRFANAVHNVELSSLFLGYKAAAKAGHPLQEAPSQQEALQPLHVQDSNRDAAANQGVQPATAAAGSTMRSLFDVDSSSNDTSVGTSSSSGGINSSNSSTSNSEMPMDIGIMPANSSAAASSAAANPWYDQHEIGSYSAGTDVLYGTQNTSSSSSSLLISSDEDGINDTAEASAGSEPPLYVYPTSVRHPTVFFTVVLQGYNTVVGLGPAEKVAFSAAVNAFLAPSPSVIVSNTSIIIQARAGSDLWFPCATAQLAGDANLHDFLASTLQGDPNLVFPTAAWGTVRTVNVKVVMPSTPEAVTYSWSVGDYGNCSALCGGGQQTRLVVCLDSVGNAADSTLCPSPMPASSRSCQMQPCQASLPTAFSLVLGEWGPCNSSCGPGSRTKSAMCISKEGYVGSLSSCHTTPEALAQQLWEECILPECPSYFWSYSNWICTNKARLRHQQAGCGGGTAYRNATCTQLDTSMPVDSSNCDPETMDNSTQPCATNPCLVYYWRTRELADCLPEEASDPCGRYVQRRKFDCVNMTTGDIVPHLWCSGPKPDIGDVECQSPINCTVDGQPENSPDSQFANPASDSSSDQQTVSDSSSAEPLSGGGGSSSNSSVDYHGSSSSSEGHGEVPVALLPSSSPSPGTGGFASSAPGGPAPSNSSSISPGGGHLAGGGSSSGGSSSSPGPSPASIDTAAAALAVSNASNSSNTTASTAPVTASASSKITQAAPSTVPSGSSSGSSSGAHLSLGPGQQLPAWLLANPTAALRLLLECPAGYALSAGGACCKGSLLDSKGACCDAGYVDACGVCNGTGKAIDVLGACCRGTLDAQGVCCASSIDECGVCNGTNSCDLRADVLASLPAAALYLIPNSNANRRLRLALQEAVAASIMSVSGRPFEQGRLSVTLSAYSMPAGSNNTGSNGTATQLTTVVAARSYNGLNRFPQQWNTVVPAGSSSSSTMLGTASTPASVPAAAYDLQQSLPARVSGSNGAGKAPDSAGLSQPPSMFISSSSTVQQEGNQAVQLDTLSDTEQQQVPKSASAGHSNSWFIAETAARILAVSYSGIKQLIAYQSSNSSSSSSNSTCLQQVASDASSRSCSSIGNGSGGSSSAREADIAASSTSSTSSNTIVVGVVVHSSTRQQGVDTGIALLALNRLPNSQLVVPGSNSKLKYGQVASIVRSGICGDGVCQVNERLSWNNPDSCPQDCALPFLSCPPFNSSLPPCSGKGVCYNSIGSCSCTTGYTGAGCSICALDYKLVNGFCVSAAYLAPARLCMGAACNSNLTTSNSLLSLSSNGPRSLAGGIGAVTGIVLGTMLVVAVAAALVKRFRQRRLLQDYEEGVRKTAEGYTA